MEQPIQTGRSSIMLKHLALVMLLVSPGATIAQSGDAAAAGGRRPANTTPVAPRYRPVPEVSVAAGASVRVTAATRCAFDGRPGYFEPVDRDGVWFCDAASPGTAIYGE